MAQELKRVEWIGSARSDLKTFPDQVQREIGYALFEAQRGRKSLSTKPLHGFGGAGVLEIIEDFQSNTYRAVYTVKFEKRVYVLHSFQKKSKRGIATPKAEIDLIKRRLKLAEQHYERLTRG